MSKQKFYAVKKGNQIGIFDNWNDCQKSTSGYPGADFKVFLSFEEADAYIKDEDIYLNKIKEDLKNGYDCVAFSDGSYDEEHQKYSYGAVIFDEKLEIHELYSAYGNPKYLDSKNVAGEVFAVINILDWAVSNQLKKVKIYHDYEGVAKWSNGEWKTNTPISRLLYKLVNDKYYELLDITFEHVKGHSNNRYNEYADRLAKQALSSKSKSMVKGDNWFKVSGCIFEEVVTLISIIQNDYTNINVTKMSEDKRITFKLKMDNSVLSVTIFKTGTVLVQGRMNALFQIFTSYFTELIDEKEIVPVLKNAYKMEIDSRQIESVFKDLFRSLPKDYPSSMNTLLKQSVINMTNHIKSEDYGQYVFPSFRALEGHLKYLLRKREIKYTGNFNMFNKNQQTNQYYLTNTGNTDASQKQQIETCYNLWKKHRDTLFHFGESVGNTNVDDTRLISTYEEACELIKECLITIQETL